MGRMREEAKRKGLASEPREELWTKRSREEKNQDVRESTWVLRRHLVKMDELNRNQKLGEEVKSRPWWERFRLECR